MNTTSTQPRLAFIDWMKCLGMILIVHGHTGGPAVVDVPTQPFNSKQLGVAFFVFVLGYSLARDTRPIGRVLFNRLFDIYLFGVACAVAIGMCQFVLIGDVNESNFLPFAFGANVAFNSFPANPTTWYIGTYIHLVVIWALLLRGSQIRFSWIVISSIAETVIRAMLIELAGDFVAYMSFTNWTTLLLLGMYVCQQGEGDSSRDLWWGVLKWTVLGLCLSVVWRQFSQQLSISQSNPFGRIPLGSPAAELLATSVSTTVLYLLYTVVCFQLTRRFGHSAVISFFARNTLLIFILHMPLVFMLTRYLYALPLLDRPGLPRIAVNMFVYFVALAFASEAIIQRLKPKKWRDRLWVFLAQRRTGTARQAMEP